ncbi:DUF6641 family protein [Sphingobium baderi]|uniref:DUF6641 family protein n=1 Tax=Sphingobium baderi TaxID=1332080 RepID=UPI002B40EA4F|nr:DUF6641 family protein [Sphingobium baderi]WRD76356.1 hypothetical protein QQ987_16645 [Sphingobium baderi]
MSILKTLKLTAATRNAPLTPEQMLRGKLVSYLNEQKSLAEAEIAGTSFVATKKVTRKNAEGENIRVDAPRHVRKGWFTDAEGKMFFQIRYGSKPLELTKGMNAVEVENLAELPSLIASIIEAINAGELDVQAKAANADRKTQRKAKQAAA